MGEWFNTEEVFSNNGGKIQGFAKGLYILYLVSYLIAGIGSIFASFVDFEYLWPLILIGALIIALAKPLAYLGTCFIHGYGELISNSYNKTVQIEQKKQATIKKFRCPKCKTQITTNDKECPGCGASFDWDKI